jgi:hypothetical protein
MRSKFELLFKSQNRHERLFSAGNFADRRRKIGLLPAAGIGAPPLPRNADRGGVTSDRSDEGSGGQSDSNQRTPAAAISGLQTPPERGETLERIRLGDFAILYVAPEQLRSRSVRFDAPADRVLSADGIAERLFHVRGLSYDGKGLAAGQGSLELKHLGRDRYQVRLHRPWSAIRKTVRLRREVAYVLLRALLKKAEKARTRFGEAPAGDGTLAVSSNEISDAVRADLALCADIKKPLAAIDRSLKDVIARATT